MNNLIKNLKMKFKNNLLIKLAKVRKENKYLKARLTEEVLSKRDLYDVITKKEEEIRRLTLGVKDDEKVFRNK